MKNAIALVRRTAGPGVVVVSALAGVTDSLLEAAGAVGRKPEGRIEEIAELLAKRHRRCLAGVVPPGPVRDELKNEIARSFGELALLSRAPVFLQDLSPATLDSLLARGEELAARIFAAGLTAARRRAVRVSPLDLIVTDGRFGGASPFSRKPTVTSAARSCPCSGAGSCPWWPDSSARRRTGGSRPWGAADRT